MHFLIHCCRTFSLYQKFSYSKTSKKFSTICKANYFLYGNASYSELCCYTLFTKKKNNSWWWLLRLCWMKDCCEGIHLKEFATMDFIQSWQLLEISWKFNSKSFRRLPIAKALNLAVIKIFLFTKLVWSKFIKWLC